MKINYLSITICHRRYIMHTIDLRNCNNYTYFKNKKIESRIKKTTAFFSIPL